MKIKHVLRAVGTCPVDGATDSYEIVVKARRVIEVEKILAEIRSLTQAPVFQEHLTRDLAVRLGVKVRTTCIHSGVVTVCRA